MGETVVLVTLLYGIDNRPEELLSSLLESKIVLWIYSLAMDDEFLKLALNNKVIKTSSALSKNTFIINKMRNAIKLHI